MDTNNKQQSLLPKKDFLKSNFCSTSQIINYKMHVKKANTTYVWSFIAFLICIALYIVFVVETQKHYAEWHSDIETIKNWIVNQLREKQQKIENQADQQTYNHYMQSDHNSSVALVQASVNNSNGLSSLLNSLQAKIPFIIASVCLILGIIFDVIYKSLMRAARSRVRIAANYIRGGNFIVAFTYWTFIPILGLVFSLYILLFSLGYIRADRIDGSIKTHVSKSIYKSVL